MYWVEINNGNITGKGISPEINEFQLEVTEAIFNQLSNFPISFTMNEIGEIISVTPAPEPEPAPYTPTLEERLAAAEFAINDLILGGNL